MGQESRMKRIRKALFTRDYPMNEIYKEEAKLELFRLFPTEREIRRCAQMVGRKLKKNSDKK